MRILYGVVREGMGQATRSRVLLEELIEEHDVRIVASGRAYDYLAARFGGVHEIWGITFAYDKGEVRRVQTVVRNLTGALSGWPRNVREYFRLAEAFEPDVVVTDFEAFASLFALRHRLPLVSVDNIRIIDRCRHDDVIAGYEGELRLARSVIALKVPTADHYIVTTFFYPAVVEERTTLVPSILRPEIVSARPERGEHVLVYQTASGDTGLAEALRRSRAPFRVYGLRRDIDRDVVEGNVVYRPFSENGFVDDLRTARAVIAGGGFTLLSEAVYLGKPVLSIPLGGQFEQVVNALYLERLGYGVHATETSAETIGAFLERAPDCEHALADYRQDGNTVALRVLREQLDALTHDRREAGE